MSNSMADIACDTRAILIIGSNTTEQHPVFGAMLRQAALRGTKIVVADPRQIDMVEFEKTRIRGAIRTDAILSAEIIVIVLGTVQNADLVTRIAVLSFLAAAITIGVYGLVAGIVKMDDVGMHLMAKEGDSGSVKFQRWFGRWILGVAPKFLRLLSIVGTVAMFLVGGGILVHGLPAIAEGLHLVEVWASALPVGGLMSLLASLAYDGLFGFIAGGVIVGVFLGIKKILPKRAKA